MLCFGSRLVIFLRRIFFLLSLRIMNLMELRMFLLVVKLGVIGRIHSVRTILSLIGSIITGLILIIFDRGVVNT